MAVRESEPKLNDFLITKLIGMVIPEPDSKLNDFFIWKHRMAIPEFEPKLNICLI